MKISTKGRYALRVMLDLALHNSGDLVPLKDIAKRQDITIKYLEQIISPLQKAGFVTSFRGSNGGYRLSKRPSEYSCGDILRVMEGSLVPTGCAGIEEYPDCPLMETCATLPFWKGLSKVINDYVDNYTLEDLVNNQLAMQDDYVI